MKKFTLFTLVFVFISLNISAQQKIIVGQNYLKPNDVTLVAERGISTTLKFDLNELNLTEVTTGYGTANVMTSEKAPMILEAGVPELIYLPAAIIIPDAGSATLDIAYGNYTEMENIEIAPSKGSLSRSIDPQTVPYIKGDVYNQNAFFPGNLAELNEPFIMRDVRGQTLFVYPVQYNPVTKVLRIYSEITVTVNYTDTPGANEFTTQKRHATIDPAFAQMYNNLFMNYNYISRDYPTGEEGELLIICHPAFTEAMKPYIDWKRTIGRKTTMVTTAETGTTAAAIKTYITNYYNEPDNNLAYVLLIGDSPQVPPHTAQYSRSSDNLYGRLVGTDPYLEVLIGRMSAANLAQVQTQVQRSIWYERDMTITDTWIPKALGIACSEGSGGGHDGGEADYIHMNNIRTRLLNYGYDPVYQEYNGSTGVPVTSPTQISQRFNDGVSVANYCNHGDETGWTLSNGGYSYIYYRNANVNALQNAGKLPFIFSVACLNGKFTYSQDCFAEAWLRATQNNQPTGAVATFMAWESLSWLPPMTAQDEFIDLCLNITHTAGGFNYGMANNTLKTFAGTALNATQRMIMRHGYTPGAQLNSGSDYDTWMVFGDPTLQFRTKTPQEMTIFHLPAIPLGAESFTVECDADGAFASLTYMDENDEVIILGTATVIDGVAEIVLAEPITAVAELTVAVTGFNKVTYLSEPIYVGGELELNEPLHLQYTVALANHVSLTWDAPESSTLPVKGYNVYRDSVLITADPIKEERTYTDIVSQNGEYTYTVTAWYGNELESEPSNPVTVVVNGMCIPIGNDITLEKIKTENETVNILVSWNAPDYAGTELAGYNVLRNSEQLNTEILTELSFLDENLELEHEYCYIIEAVYNDCAETLRTDPKCTTIIDAIKDISADNRFRLFPNPAKGMITIEGAGLNRVEMYDITGRKLADYPNLNNNLQIDVNQYENGIYLLKLYANDHVVSVRKLSVIK